MRLLVAVLALPALAALASCTSTAPATRGGDCVAPAAIADGDDDLAAFGEACASTRTVAGGGAEWSVVTVRSRRRGPLFVVPHDDEDAALATAAYAVRRYGGAVTTVDTGGSRTAGGIDPNRNFDAGRLSCGRPGRAKGFVEAMLAPGGRPVIALHTNEPGRGGTISIDTPYAGATAFPAPGADPDAMVILAARRGGEDPAARRLAAALNARGVNVMVERVDLADTDCSLSHYAVASGIRYANVEARDGDVATQRAILDALMAVL
jgi:hypothetical protein